MSQWFHASGGYVHRDDDGAGAHLVHGKFDALIERFRAITRLMRPRRFLTQARMKLDGRIRASDVRLRIDHLLRDVGLMERRDIRIGGGDDSKVLSGGEKKRLAFATEVRVSARLLIHFSRSLVNPFPLLSLSFQLLTDPEILFLDEPTTGQDAHSASVLVSHMTSFASRDRTILCTIHQPSSIIFDSFHRIILLAGGRVAFAGTGEQAIRFFARYIF